MGSGHSSYNASLSQPNVQKNSRALVRGMGGGGLKIKKKMQENNIAHTLEKIGHRLPCILYFFIHPQPNNIGPSTAAF